jgi:hypothetical protein
LLLGIVISVATADADVTAAIAALSAKLEAQALQLSALRQEVSELRAREREANSGVFQISEPNATHRRLSARGERRLAHGNGENAATLHLHADHATVWFGKDEGTGSSGRHMIRRTDASELAVSILGTQTLFIRDTGIQVAGAVTATSFAGDGSGLTGVPCSCTG